MRPRTPEEQDQILKAHIAASSGERLLPPASRVVIVARNEASLYGYLAERLTSDPSFRVIFDRRVGERRQRQEAAAVVADRRRGDRRSRSDVADRLCSIGFAIMPVS